MLVDKPEHRVVRYDPPVGLSVLFRSLPKTKVRPKLDVRYAPKSGGTVLHFKGPDALGIPEQTLLLALVEIAQAHYNADPEAAVFDGDSTSPLQRALWEKLVLSGHSAGRQTVLFSASWYEFAVKCGLSKGGAVQGLLQKQLCRLCETTVWEYEGSLTIPKCQSVLVAWMEGNDSRVHLALNFRLAAALFGERYASVSMTERLRLKTDVARAIHTFLSTTLKLGRTLSIGLGKLAARLWPDRGAKPPAGTDRRQRKAVRDALLEVGGLSEWKVEMGVDDVVNVARRYRPVRDMTTRHFANQSSEIRERAELLSASSGAAFGAVDVSGLFSTRE